MMIPISTLQGDSYVKKPFVWNMMESLDFNIKDQTSAHPSITSTIDCI